MTLILTICLLMYGSMKSIELATYDETDVMVSSKDAHFDSYYEFSEGL